MCWDGADGREIAGLRSGIWKLMGLRGGVERGHRTIITGRGECIRIILKVFRDTEMERTVLAKKMFNFKWSGSN